MSLNPQAYGVELNEFMQKIGRPQEAGKTLLYSLTTGNFRLKSSSYTWMASGVKDIYGDALAGSMSSFHTTVLWI